MKKRNVLTLIGLGVAATAAIIGVSKCLKKDEDISDMYFDDEEMSDEVLYGDEGYHMYTQTIPDEEKVIVKDFSKENDELKIFDDVEEEKVEEVD